MGGGRVVTAEEESEVAPAHGNAGARPWDGGEEEDEDDRLEGVATELLGHAPGWTIFERLYLYNHSYYIVT